MRSRLLSAMFASCAVTVALAWSHHATSAALQRGTDEEKAKPGATKPEAEAPAGAEADAADRPRDLSEEQMKRHVEAAETHARAVAGDDEAKYLRIFQRVLNAAVNAELGIDIAPVRPPAQREVIGHLEPAPPGVAAAPVPAGLPRAARPPRREMTKDPTLVENTRLLVQQRIIGGSETGEKELQDCVAIGSEFGWCCTGTLIGPNVVLTAGHCRDGCASRVFVGKDVDGPGQVIEVARAIRHRQFDPSTLENDLTLLILKKNVEGVTPRAIASASVIDRARRLLVVGYGNTDVQSTGGFGIRRKVFVPVASPRCGDAAAQDRYACHADKEIVCGAPLLDKDSCNGDSGGPGYVESGGKLFLAAATSRAIPESTRPCGDGGIYVRVDRYRSWIRSVAKANGGVLP